MTHSPTPVDATVARDTPLPSNAAGGRFAPGEIIASRYRIIALLGRGGMGEIYRAEDTRLAHPVALKFLPRTLTSDPSTIERLIGEVRVGRQVSHPNVCRLYDITESEQGHFITMEYVDGEDLGSLLRRIGRLPADKALDIARDLSAGLAAAHDVGIVHRDLKPANVMIDGRGRARITDLGLAVVAEEAAKTGELAGTPAYMAPEQLTGGTVTPRSDLYALGLILYEIFTGKRLYPGNSLNEVLSQRRSGKPASISSVIREIDPAVERVVMRCLDDDPAARPSSAHAVIASLPGGDPLEAAVAAGETPSPEMVAAAGAAGDLRPAAAWPLLMIALGGLCAIALMAARTIWIRSVPLPKSSEVLDARGQEIAEHFGYTEAARSTAHEWLWNDDYGRWMAKHDPSPNRWNAMARTRPGLMLFAFRSSPGEMSAWRPDHRLTFLDPPAIDPGMITVNMDPMGRLVEFRRVAPAAAEAPAGRADWNLAFHEAGLDVARFHPVQPSRSTPLDNDEKVAWDGTLPDQPSIPIHVEGASLRGRIVWFSVFGPWDAPQPFRFAPRSIWQRISEWANLILGAWIIAPAIILAIRNLRRGRADRRAAFRVAAVCFAATLFALLVRADYVSNPIDFWNRIQEAAGAALFTGGSAWIMYMAIEPYVRRKWPRNLIGWSRLVAGRFRDPMVGRDVLAGVIGGLLLATIGHLTRLLPPLFGFAPPQPLQSATSPLSSARHILFFLGSGIGAYVPLALELVFFMIVLRAILRRQSLAVAVMFLVLAGAFTGSGNLLYSAASAGLLLLMMLRFGLLSLVVTAVVWNWVNSVPPTLDVSVWYFQRLSLVLVAVAALSIYGFIVSLGDKPLFGAPLFEE
jgi:eukaryotic-like serine/threonine-protein kinase